MGILAPVAHLGKVSVTLITDLFTALSMNNRTRCALHPFYLLLSGKKVSPKVAVDVTISPRNIHAALNLNHAASQYQ